MKYLAALPFISVVISFVVFAIMFLIGMVSLCTGGSLEWNSWWLDQGMKVAAFFMCSVFGSLFVMFVDRLAHTQKGENHG